MADERLRCGDRVRVIGPAATSTGDTFAVGKETTVAELRTDDEGHTVYACQIRGWGFVAFPRASLERIDETMTEDVFMAHMERAVRRSQEIWPDDWRNHHTFYDGEVARLLDTLRQAADERQAWCYDCAETIHRVAKRMGSVRCRNCGNSALDMFGKPCICAIGKALKETQSHHQGEQPAQANESVGEWCDFHPGQAWVIQAWNIGMQAREWLCRDCYEKRTTGDGQQYRYDIERDRDREVEQIRDEAMAFQREHPEEHRRLVEQGMQVVNQMLAAQANEPRAIVRAFALLGMERKLAANDGVKGGWKKAHWFTLYRCMVMEKAELLNALEALDSVLAKMSAFNDRFEGGELLSRIDADEDELLRQLDTAKRDVLQEAADVSNYAMMIADVCGALPPTDERGR